MKFSESKIREVAKELMRKQSLGYRDLARHWQMAESSVKRIMSRGSLSLKQVDSLAGWLGIGLIDFLALAGIDKDSSFSYNDEQDEAMNKTPTLIYLFIRLVAGQSIDEFIQEYNLSRPEGLKLLFKLESLGLIQVLSENKVRVIRRGFSFFKDDGLVVQKFSQKFVATIFEHFFRDKKILRGPTQKSQDYFFKPFEFYLTDEAIEEMLADFEALVVKYRKRGNSDVNFEPFKKLRAVSGLAMVGKFNAWEKIIMHPNEVL